MPSSDLSVLIRGCGRVLLSAEREYMKKWLGLVAVVLLGLVFYASGWRTICAYPVLLKERALPRSSSLWIALTAAVLWDAFSGTHGTLRVRDGRTRPVGRGAVSSAATTSPGT